MTAQRSARVLAGVDGCRAGWIAVVEIGGKLDAVVTGSVAALVEALDENALIAIDIPIGLTDSGPRLCDVAARKVLGHPRASSVFPAPNRPVLVATSYLDACQIRQTIDGKRVSKQAHAIYPKIREVDELLRSSPGLQGRICEVHPEVSFAYWNGGKAMAAGKKSTTGAAARERLIEGVWPAVLTNIRARLPRGIVQRDDLNDAFAALWTARRIVDNRAVTLPGRSERDSMGLKMEIVA